VPASVHVSSIDASLDGDHIQKSPESNEVNGRNVHRLSLDVATVGMGEATGTTLANAKSANAAGVCSAL
jgi:hypothetical protein